MKKTIKKAQAAIEAAPFTYNVATEGKMVGEYLEEIGLLELASDKMMTEHFVCSTAEERKLLFAIYANFTGLAKVTKQHFQDTGSWSVKLTNRTCLLGKVMERYCFIRSEYRAAAKSLFESHLHYVNA